MIQSSQCDKCRRKVAFSLNGRIMRKLSMLILRIVWIYTCYEVHEIHEIRAGVKVLSVANVGWNVVFGLSGGIMRKLCMYCWNYFRVADVEQTLTRLWTE